MFDEQVDMDEGVRMMRVSADQLRALMDRYVDQLKPPIRSAAVESAFRRVPRHKLVERFYVYDDSRGGYMEIVSDPSDPEPEKLALIYSNRVLVTRLGPNGMPSSSTSEPALMAQMLELLRLEQGHKVLEIGAGTGYNAALIAEIVGAQSNVVTVDIQEDVVEQARRLLHAAGYGNVKLVHGDGFFGLADEAPFDRVVATVGLFDVSPHWTSQLATDGEMLLPVHHRGPFLLLSLHRKSDVLAGNIVGVSGFMPVQGQMSPTQVTGRSRDQSHQPRNVVRHPGWPMSILERRGLWLYAMASDQRASLMPVPGQGESEAWRKWTFGISDGAARVVVDEDEVVLVGEAEPLLVTLEQIRSSWETAGRPKQRDYRVEFLPKESNPRPQAGLVMERKYHWQVLTWST